MNHRRVEVFTRKASRQSFALASALLLLLAACVPAAVGARGRAKTHAAVSSAVSSTPPAAVRYRIDAARSKFMVRAFSGGLLWFKGHDHFVAVRDFSGEAEITPGAVAPASLNMRVRADSLAETRDLFNEQQKQIINREMREIVLEADKYPEIIFRSTDVTGAFEKGVFKVKVGGDLTLHGTTRRVTIPAEVTVSDTGELRARGEFNIKRSDFNVRATSAFHGMVRVRDRLKLTFDIVAHQV
jgi:polyisoprenoid-binding protein YceI